MQTYLNAFQTHLEDERQVSPHTVRNYLGDLRQFLDAAAEARGENAAPLSHPGQIDAGMIRTYLKVLYQRAWRPEPWAARWQACAAFCN